MALEAIASLERPLSPNRLAAKDDAGGASAVADLMKMLLPGPGRRGKPKALSEELTAARANSERAELEKLLSSIMDLRYAGEAPVLAELALCTDPVKAQWSLLRGARAGTIRSKLRSWTKFHN